MKKIHYFTLVHLWYKHKNINLSIKVYEQRLQGQKFAGIFFFCIHEWIPWQEIDSFVNVNV